MSINVIQGNTIIEYNNYINKWKLHQITNGGCSEMFKCQLKNGENKKWYMLKIFQNYEDNFLIDSTTIKLHIKLSSEKIMPDVYDCGYVYADEYYIGKSRPCDPNPKNDKVCYYVMDNYIASGETYLEYVISSGKDKDKDYMDNLYKNYIKKVFTLYKKLAILGICSFDVKDANVVVNCDKNTGQIEDLRLIDIDCGYVEITSNPTKTLSTIYFTAMILMNFMIYIRYFSVKHSGKNLSSPIEYYYGLIRKDFNFDLLIDLKFSLDKNNPMYKDNTYMLLFCCYYKNIKTTEFLEYEESYRINMFKKYIHEVLEKFPFDDK